MPHQLESLRKPDQPGTMEGGECKIVAKPGRERKENALSIATHKDKDPVCVQERDKGESSE